MPGVVCSWAGNEVDWNATAAFLQAIVAGLAIVFAVRSAAGAARLQHQLDVQKAEDALRQTRMGRIAALEAEIRTCAVQCRVYIEQFFAQRRIVSPGYRLPRLAYDQTLPLLQADGLLSIETAMGLNQFFVDALSFNRSLDSLSALELDGGVIDHRSALYENEANRAVMKALHIVPLDAPERGLCPQNLQHLESRFGPALQALADARAAVENTGGDQAPTTP